MRWKSSSSYHSRMISLRERGQVTLRKSTKIKERKGRRGLSNTQRNASCTAAAAKASECADCRMRMDALSMVVGSRAAQSIYTLAQKERKRDQLSFPFPVHSTGNGAFSSLTFIFPLPLLFLLLRRLSACFGGAKMLLSLHPTVYRTGSATLVLSCP